MKTMSMFLLFLLIVLFIVLFFVIMRKNSAKGNNNNKFVKDSLLPDEKIVATAKFHPLKIWLAPILMLFFGFFVLNSPILLVNILEGLILILILVCLTFFFQRWISKYDEFVITNKRVVAKVGVIRRIAFELQSEQVESIEIHQGIVGRILNYGTLVPCGIGASKVRIPFVVNPFEFRQHFYDLKKPQNN